MEEDPASTQQQLRGLSNGRSPRRRNAADGTESCDVKAVLVKKPQVLAIVEDFLLDADMMPSGSECFTLPGQLRLIDQVKDI